MIRLGSIASLVTTATDLGEMPFVGLESVDAGTGRLSSGELPTVSLPDSGAASAAVGDVLFGKLRPYLAKTWRVDRPVYASTELMCLRPRDDIESGWLAYVAMSRPVIEWAVASSDGAKMPRTSWDRFRQYRLLVPPPDEQRAIAAYLDRETARIDALIAAKRRAIFLYRERRQSLRDNAFDSVPGFRLKHLLRQGMAYGVLVPEFVEDGPRVPMIRTYNLTARGAVDREDIAEIPLSLANQYRRTCLEEGDLILSVVGSMGRAAVAGPREVGSNLNRPLARLQPKAELGARLLWHWTQTTHFMDSAMLATGGGTAQPTLNLGDLANFHVGLPADERRWREILSMLEAGCRKLDRLEDTASSQTALLYERRQALITAAVTGHIDVSVAA